MVEAPSSFPGAQLEMLDQLRALMVHHAASSLAGIEASLFVDHRLFHDDGSPSVGKKV